MLLKELHKSRPQGRNADAMRVFGDRGEFISLPEEVIRWQQLVKKSLEQCQRLFGVECSDGIEAHGAQRREVTGGDGGEHGGYVDEGGEIVGRDTVKQAGHEVRNNTRANQAYAGSRGGQTEALP
jgi:hypothetical protein